MQSAKTVVTLVHGTWATNAAWVEPSSKLSSELLARLPQPLVTNVFRWSGKNSASARNSAAANLAEQLRKLIDANPGARHYVIGHSHGGNVALKAVGPLICLIESVLFVCRHHSFT
ncbi:alpha/beta fold hydrolase [Edaphobacter dinghuensis]|uniref:alpha/beta fold hydrolase n=1 Tax=Edaphobacter dinghuensis TaxID=1560005 RepID=UPI001666DFA2